MARHGLNERRKRALERLYAQRERGTKPMKRTHPHHNRNVSLSIEDIDRIHDQILTLEKRIEA